MAYATVEDVQARMLRRLSPDEENVCETYLEDAAIMIDAAASGASADAKKVVSCRMVMRTMADDGSGAPTIPAGATQGSMSALGYSQSWTFGTTGAVGELYLSKQDRILLGSGNHIGSRSPVEDLVCEVIA